MGNISLFSFLANMHADTTSESDSFLSEDEMCEYELKRQENIREINEFLRDLGKHFNTV